MMTAYVTHPIYVEHHLAGHPEHSGRIRAVWSEIDKAGLDTRFNRIEAPAIDEEWILTVHMPKYLELLHWIEKNPPRGVHHLDPDTYAGAKGFQIAKLSVGGVIQAVDEVLSEHANNALAAVRPPGHHAMPEHAMGFCLLGNVPIATRYAQKTYGVERIMIVDFDVHHGNGTEAMLYDDPTTLFISTHQYPFYPGTGAITDIGVGKGEGFTINIPLAAGHADTSYAELYKEIVWPAAQRFKPELMIVSAGFDAHWLDPIAGMRLSLTGYAHLTHELIKMADELCNGKIVFAMEGGYNLEVLSHGMVNIAHALLGNSTVSDPLGLPHDQREPDIKPLIRQLKHIHRL